MSEITHVMFDFDGTLADSQQYWCVVYLDIFRDRGYAVEERDYAICRKNVFSDRWEYLTERFGITQEQRPSPEDVIQYVERYYMTQNVCKPGVTEYLEALKKQGKTLAVFSATREESIRPALAYLGIDGYFDFVFSGRQIGVGKENPESYRYCLNAMGVSAEHCVMVEDALYSMKTAKSLGMTVYALHEDCNSKTDPEIRALADKYGYSMTDFLED